MGNFYKNVTVLGPSQADVVGVLERHARIAYVTPSHQGITVVFDREVDAAGGPAELGDIALTLSQDLACTTIAAAVYDDDVLLLALYQRGTQIGEYNSSGGSTLSAASLGRAVGLSRARVLLVWAVLGAPRLPLFLFETWRHFLLLRFLRMPAWAGGTGYKYVHQGEPPPDLGQEYLVHVGEKRPWGRRLD
jgi:hypothetical protein